MQRAQWHCSCFASVSLAPEKEPLDRCSLTYAHEVEDWRIQWPSSKTIRDNEAYKPELGIGEKGLGVDEQGEVLNQDDFARLPPHLGIPLHQYASGHGEMEIAITLTLSEGCRDRNIFKSKMWRKLGGGDSLRRRKSVAIYVRVE